MSEDKKENNNQEEQETIETPDNKEIQETENQQDMPENNDVSKDISDNNIDKPKKKKSLFKKIVIALFLLCFVAGLVVAGGVGVYVYKLSKELPTIDDLANFRYKQPTVVYTSDNEVIAELGDERRYPVTIEKMPKHIKNAVVAVEDSRFYEHGGLDYLGIFRAFIKNLKAGRVVEGGSTLTQQLVKVIYLNPERKLRRKVKEAILANRIDKNLTKEKILELYLNQVYFGRGAYGVEAAAINYFGKSVKDLSLGECALIAGLPKSPSGYAPHIHPEKALKRRQHVLYRMFETGYITEKEMKEAAEEDIAITETIPPKNNKAGYFVDYVIKYLKEGLQIEDPANEGLRVYTTLNLDYQKKAEKAVKDNLISVSKDIGYYGPIGVFKTEAGDSAEEKSKLLKKLFEIDKGYINDLGYLKALVTDVKENSAQISLQSGTGQILLKENRWAVIPGSGKKRLTDLRDVLDKDDIIYVSINSEKDRTYHLEQEPPLESSMLVVTPQTGVILAMVGGFDYERSKFNRAIQAKRQVGSLFKPIVYSTAFEHGYTPMTEIFDAPIIKQMEEKDEYWTPGNHSDKFYGLTTLKEGLTKSRNVVTIKLAEKVGIGRILEQAKKFGITEELQRDLSVSIGSGSVSLSEMVYAFSVFPNLGNRHSPLFVLKVEDVNGETLAENTVSEPIEAVSPETAQMMTDLLFNVVHNGTGVRAKRIPRMLAGKTGTTNDSKDTWFIGFMPKMVCGVWVGFDNFKEIGEKRYGSNTALPGWITFVKSVLNDYPFETFPVAENVVYKKVDTETNKTTDSFTESYTFEPFKDNVSKNEKGEN